MVASIGHRGPDGAGVWSLGPMGLGHRMLWTTPESLHEKLPLVNESGEIAITADARIDNRDDLIALLGIPGRSRERISDSQLILHAYEKWGEHCPERLLGDFAFAVWDGRRQVLFCARDYFGVKPFYYHGSDQAFRFASEIKALLCLPQVPRSLNEARVAEYLMLMLDDKAATLYRDIFRLPPAHTMTVSREGIRLQAYWSLDPSRELRLGSDAEYAEAFRGIFTEAVRCRLRSAFPTGAMLSGGLDSSSITCAARELLAQEGGPQLHTFSAIFDNVPECDERPFINAVLAGGRIQAHYLYADRLSPLADLDRVFWHEDEAFQAPNLFMHWGLYRAANQQGVRALLDGIDGDTTVSHGAMYLTELARAWRWIPLAKEIRKVAPHFGLSPGKLVCRYVWRYSLISPARELSPRPLRTIWWALRRRHRSAREMIPIINRGFALRSGLEQRIQARLDRRSNVPQTEREHHCQQLTGGIIPFFLEVADRAGAAFSVEPRYPFFDKRLAEFCLALPSEQKLHDGWTRVVMRRAMSGLLPVEVQWRGGKSDLSPNFTRGLLTSDRKLLDDVILNDPGAVEEYVDISALREAYHRYMSRRSTDDELTVWNVVLLALWVKS